MPVRRRPAPLPVSRGRARIDACTLQLDAATRLLNDERHQVPVGREPVTGTGYDFRTPRPIGEQQIDDAFTDLAPRRRGHLAAPPAVPRRRSVELWVDEHYPFLEVYSGDTLAPGRRRTRPRPSSR